ncbi:hypothetical protein bmyco0003_19890 [Bacillus pseudomycoides]|nr:MULTISPECIES: hypothetical protein [Bacillus]EEM01609.1 hypothetical protein bmyco0002_60880 [Bacillus pseudomycoides]EEM11294.1 hypothetical protein bmyco0003_19890 [Bacillus pseudomycoides]
MSILFNKKEHPFPRALFKGLRESSLTQDIAAKVNEVQAVYACPL